MPTANRCRSTSRPLTDAASPLLRQFLLHLASERGLAENSIGAYRRDLEDLDRFLRARGAALDSTDPEDYLAYLQSQSRAGRATRTLSRRIAAIRALLRFRQGEGHDVSAVLHQLQRPKPQRSLPNVLSRAQVDQLIASPNPKSTLFSRDVAILELLYAAGLRASELCDLKVGDVNLQVGCVRVLGKGMKERIVPIGQAAREALVRYLLECRPRLDRGRTQHLFLSRTGRPMERIALWMLVEKHGRRSGLLRHISPHVLRHCFASHMVGGGADLRIVQELLGHADVSTTQIYTHVDQTRLKSLHSRFHPRG